MDRGSRGVAITGYVIAGLLVVAVATFIGVVLVAPPHPPPTPPQEPTATPTPTPTMQPTPASVAVEQLRYSVRVQRHGVSQGEGAWVFAETAPRESWRAADGWTWTRQTGDDQLFEILAPDSNWQVVHAVPASVSDLTAHLRAQVNGSTPADTDDAVFEFVAALLGSDSLPADTLPDDYRAALVGVAANLDGATTKQNVPDPQRRGSTRITYVNEAVRPGIVRSLYVDTNNTFLAIERTQDDSESWVEAVIDPQLVDEIPSDVIQVLGQERVAKQVRP